MWFVQPKQDYVSQIPWKHADEPDVMSWRIRARNYNIFVANILFSVLFFVCLGSAYLMSFGGWSLLSKFLIGGGMFLLFLLITMSMTHQTSILVYRFTEKNAEVCSWKPQMDAVKPFLKWSAIILMPIVLVLILMDPSLLITSLGPLAMGFAAWMMGSSKGYQEMARGSRHEEIDWTKTEHIKVWRKRSMIALTYQWKPFKRNSSYRPRTHLLYCFPEELDDRIQFFKEHLPDAKYEEGNIDIP
ncbi:hypothetical protein [Halomonas sp. BL6]|uniref:hypothetical protein n=1 Tax=Halomonas sp. BL6 TaxID=2585770 RepID=UPI00111AA9A8|nr:hypothetical protein [Halomonas sp. BL6]TNH18480.1 hypothetical protein FHJ80_03690 [Halomonas sp. BL6]